MEINVDDITSRIGVYNIVKKNFETKTSGFDNALKQIGYTNILSVIDHRNFIEMIKNIKPEFNVSRQYKKLRPYISTNYLNNNYDNDYYNDLKYDLEEALTMCYHYAEYTYGGQI